MSDNEAEGPPAPKRQRLSKAEKRQLKNERFQEMKQKRRLLTKEKKKQKKQKLSAEAAGKDVEKPPPRKKMADSECKVRVAVEMAFDEMMSEKDQKKAASQLAYAYSANRRVPNPLQFYLVALSGPSKELFDARSGSNWDVHSHEQSLEELFDNDEIVYLCAESDDELNELDATKVYVIGGLVDHNAHKGFCYERARQKGWKTARLPIDSFVKLNSRKVLVINHVFEILLHYAQTKDWKEAFFKVIPQRKGVEAIEAEGAKDDKKPEEAESKKPEEPSTDQ